VHRNRSRCGTSAPSSPAIHKHPPNSLNLKPLQCNANFYWSNIDYNSYVSSTTVQIYDHTCKLLSRTLPVHEGDCIHNSLPYAVCVDQQTARPNRYGLGVTSLSFRYAASGNSLEHCDCGCDSDGNGECSCTCAFDC